MTSDDKQNSDKRKQSLYFPEDMLNEIKAEADRMNTSLSGALQAAWRLARETIMKYPGAD